MIRVHNQCRRQNSIPPSTALSSCKSYVGRNYFLILLGMSKSYSSTITAILDKLAPYTDIRRYARKMSPWYDLNCYVTKLRTRRLERAYRRSPGHASLIAWRSQFKRQKRKFVEYWSTKISSSSGNSRTLCTYLRCLLSRLSRTHSVVLTQPMNLPSISLTRSLMSVNQHLVLVSRLSTADKSAPSFPISDQSP